MGFELRNIPVEVDEAVGLAWQESDCLLCGSSLYEPWLEGADRVPGNRGLWFLIVRCRECGLCFTNPRPSPEAMSNFQRPGPTLLSPRHPRRIGWWQRLPGLGNLRRFLAPAGNRRLLDVGCGQGSFLRRMRDLGWNVVGLDPSPAVVRDLLDQKIAGLVGSPADIELPAQSFAAITMWHTLEHCHDPIAELRGAYRLLAPSGRLIVRVPNLESLAFRWFGPAWNGLDLPRHLVHFTPMTLKRMLRRAGFRHLEVRMIRRGSWIRQSARLACRQHPHPSPWFPWLQGKTLSGLAAWFCYATRQSDCMMAVATKK